MCLIHVQLERENEQLKAGQYQLEKETSHIKWNMCDLSLSKEQLLALLDSCRATDKITKSRVTPTHHINSFCVTADLFH